MFNHSVIRVPSVPSFAHPKTPGTYTRVDIIKACDYDELSDQGYTSLPKSDESESGQMVLK